MVHGGDRAIRRLLDGSRRRTAARCTTHPWPQREAVRCVRQHPARRFQRRPTPGALAQDLRVLPDGGVLVSSGQVIARLNGSGVVTQTYEVPGEGAPLVGARPGWRRHVLGGQLPEPRTSTGSISTSGASSRASTPLAGETRWSASEWAMRPVMTGDASIEVFSTCPPSSGVPRDLYLRTSSERSRGGAKMRDARASWFTRTTACWIRGCCRTSSSSRRNGCVRWWRCSPSTCIRTR